MQILLWTSALTHTPGRSRGVSTPPTHQAGWSTRWPGCRTSCWAAAPTRRSGPPQWTCSWCLGGDWPPSPSSPSGPPAEGRSRRWTHTAHTALPHIAGTPRCRSGRTCPPCRTEQPTPRSVWTASGCRSSLGVETGALKRGEGKRFYQFCCYGFKHDQTKSIYLFYKQQQQQQHDQILYFYKEKPKLRSVCTEIMINVALKGPVSRQKTARPHPRPRMSRWKYKTPCFKNASGR